MAAAILQQEFPAPRLLAVMRGGDPAVELDIPSKIELVGVEPGDAGADDDRVEFGDRFCSVLRLNLFRHVHVLLLTGDAAV